MTDLTLLADGDLVARLLAGDESAFAWVIDMWSGGMLRLARRYVRSQATAEDVVQESWVAVLRGLHGFAGRSSLRSWVYGIVLNVARSHAGKEHRVVPSGSLQDSSDSTGLAAGPTVDPVRFRGAEDPYPGHWTPAGKPVPWGPQAEPGPEHQALGAEVRRLVGTLVERLPEQQRLVVTLRDMQGWSAAEVCPAARADGGQPTSPAAQGQDQGPPGRGGLLPGRARDGGRGPERRRE